MSKNFLLSFVLVLLALNIGLRAGSWLSPSKTKVVRVKEKSKPQIQVVRIPVEAKPAKCEPKRTVASVARPLHKRKKAHEKAAEELTAIPAPTVVPTPAVQQPLPPTPAVQPPVPQPPAAESVVPTASAPALSTPVATPVAAPIPKPTPIPAVAPIAPVVAPTPAPVVAPIAPVAAPTPAPVVAPIAPVVAPTPAPAKLAVPSQVAVPVQVVAPAKVAAPTQVTTPLSPKVAPPSLTPVVEKPRFTVFPEGKPVTANLTPPVITREPASLRNEPQDAVATPGLMAPKIRSIQTED